MTWIRQLLLRASYRSAEAIYPPPPLKNIAWEETVLTDILQPVYLGVAFQVDPKNRNLLHFGLSTHDGTYSIDFYAAIIRMEGPSLSSDSGVSGSSSLMNGDLSQSVSKLPPIPKDELPAYLADLVIEKLTEQEQKHLYKYVGAGIDSRTVFFSPELPSRLWRELDIVALVLELDTGKDLSRPKARLHALDVDEDADALARKALE